MRPVSALVRTLTTCCMPRPTHFFHSPSPFTFIPEGPRFTLYGLDDKTFISYLRLREMALKSVTEITLLKCYSLLFQRLLCLCRFLFFSSKNKRDFLNDLNLLKKKAASSLYKQSFVCPVCFQMLIKSWIYMTAAFFFFPFIVHPHGWLHTRKIWSLHSVDII